MLKNPVLIIFITCLLVGLLVFSFTPNMSDLVSKQFFPTKMQGTNLQVAKYINVRGQVWRSYFGRTRKTRLRRAGSLHHQDLITVERSAYLDIGFPSGTRLRLMEKTQAIIEYWNPADTNSPVYVNILMGNFELIKQGQRGKVFIIKDRHLFSPAHRPKDKVFVLRLDSSKLGLAKTDKQLVKKALNRPVDTSNKVLPPSTIQSGKTTTLTNKYIEDVITSQKKNFQRCQANAIRKMGKVKGTVLVGFTIQPQGKIKDVKILQTSINNQQLTDCLISVFKICRFQKFTGAPIVRSYPLSFE